MTFQTLRMLNYLRKHADGMTETYADGTQWAQVCTANISITGIRKASHAGYLSALERAGFYRKTDKYFGLVRL